jgi:hypothetical protein
MFYDSFDYAVSRTGWNNDKIVLYTAAKRTANGNWMFDDGQIWELAVQVRRKHLYACSTQKYVQNGSISYSLFTAKDKTVHPASSPTGREPMWRSSTTSNSSKGNAFTGTPVYSSDSINFIHAVLTFPSSGPAFRKCKRYPGTFILS